MKTAKRRYRPVFILDSHKPFRIYRKEDLLKKLFLLFIISLGISGCGGFTVKDLSPFYSVSAEQMQGVSAPWRDQVEPNRVRQESPEKVFESAGPGEENNLAAIGGSRDLNNSRSKSPEPELLPEPILHSESLRKESLRFSEVENEFFPSAGQVERERIAEAENLRQATGGETKSENSQESLLEKIGKKNGGSEESRALVGPIGSREEGADFTSEALWFLGKGNSLMVLTLHEASPEAAVASPPSFSSAHSKFPSLVHDKVGDYVDFFQNRANGFFARALGRSTTYEDMMKRILREKDLPEELFYLALIESGFDPKAFSRAKASGIWQFVGKTAKRYGLKVDKWVDERRDPEKATYAAAEYLKNLYSMFNDWDLATASYNAGEGRILRAMKKADSQDFWKISQQRTVKKETKEYVPMFLAAVTIAQAPHKYGFQNIKYSPPLIYEKVTVPQSTSLVIIAKAAETDLSAIQALNPALKKGKTPPHSSFEIKLPLGKKESFEKKFPALSKKAVKSKKHRVRKGENLVNIAQKYQLTLLDLCDMNDLAPKDRVKTGTLLLLPPA